MLLNHIFVYVVVDLLVLWVKCGCAGIRALHSPCLLHNIYLTFGN